MNELLNLAKIAASNAGKEILKHYNDYKVIKKPDNSPLTSADLAANETIFKILGKTGIEICSEESILEADKMGENDTFWLVDPLDGTRDFIAKNGEFCVCIALIKNSRPILSVIFIPTKNELFYSAGDNKVFINDELIKPNSNYITPNVLLLGRSGMGKRRIALAKNFGLSFKRVGSAIKFCQIAKSQALLYPRFGDSYLWDIAAGDFLVVQSGGIILDLKTKKKPLYNGKKLLNSPFIAIDKNSIHLKEQILKKIDEILVKEKSNNNATF